MKTLIPITIAIFLSTFGALAQGTVQMQGRLGTVVQAQVFGVFPGEVQKQGNMATNFPPGTQTYGGALLTGSGFSAQLFAGPNGTQESSLTAVLGTLTSFRTGAFAGFWSSPGVSIPIPGTSEGEIVTLQVRAWDNRNGTITSWDQLFLAGNENVPHGMSAVFQSTPLGGLSPPTVLENVRSFNIWVIPEPQTVAMLTLGALGLWLFRRKQPAA